MGQERLSFAINDPMNFTQLHAIHIDGEAHLLKAFRAIDLKLMSY